MILGHHTDKYRLAPISVLPIGSGSAKCVKLKESSEATLEEF